MKEYKTEDGLRFLDYLGLLKFMQPEEIDEFKYWWEIIYKNNNPIKAVYDIYTIILPVTLAEGSYEKKQDICFPRVKEFKTRLGMSIEEAYTTGITLDEILSGFEKDAKVS